MADFLKLEAENQVANSRTTLVGKRSMLRGVILTVKPEDGISGAAEPINGIVAEGAGDGGAGVRGSGNEGDGVKGFSSKQFGVTGSAEAPNKSGVFGEALKGVGVRGRGRIGIVGESLSVAGEDPAGAFGVVGEAAGSDTAGVFGRHAGAGSGVVGDSAAGTSGAVLGRHHGRDGQGVRGEGAIGVFGESSKDGFAAVAGNHTGEGFGVVGDAASGNTAGVLGRHRGAHGVRGEGKVGVKGLSSAAQHPAVWGEHSGAGFGVAGDAASGDTAGVIGRHQGPDGQGVRGEGTVGVFGRSAKGIGVSGEVAAGDSNTAGVLGRHNGAFEGHGVRGEGPIGVSGKGAPGVDGICTGSGGSSGEPAGELAGVRGNAAGGPGVFGAGRYGGQFKGTSAQLSLIPGTTAGRPTTDFHSKGEIYMDSAATLFVCIADGNPGTWVRVVTAAT
jgi:hypothetical protein